MTGAGCVAAKRAWAGHCQMDEVRGCGDELQSRQRHYPTGDVLDEIAVMKWVLLAAVRSIVFVCAVALFGALPGPLS